MKETRKRPERDQKETRKGGKAEDKSQIGRFSGFFLGADDADDADSFSLLTDYPLSKIIAQRHQRNLRLKN